MKFDTGSVIAGIGIAVAGAVIIGITCAWFHYYFRICYEVKKKLAAKKGYRQDLELFRMALAEKGYAHIGYFILSVIIVGVGMKTDAFAPDSRFLIISALALLIWFIVVPGRGVLAFREMIGVITTPSEPSSLLQQEAPAIPVTREPAATLPAAKEPARLAQLVRAPRKPLASSARRRTR